VGRMGSRRLLGRRALSQAARRSSSGLSSSGSESRDRAYCRDLRRRFRRLGSTGRAHRTASWGLEYCGESGRFHYNHWDISDGPVYRSLRFDHRNREGESQPSYLPLTRAVVPLRAALRCVIVLQR
jgi:hypothetical protein